MRKRIFITGASGFIGANLTKRLVLDEYEVVALLGKNSYHPFLNDISIERVFGNITDKSSIEKGMRGCSYVYHCAAKISFNRYDCKELYHVNVSGTRNVLEAALRHNVEKFIHISACAVFGYSRDKKEIIDEYSNYKVRSNSVYAYTKKLAEEDVQKYVQEGLDVSIANLATVYGQGDRKMNSGSIIKAIYENKIRFAPPGGTSYVTVDDLISGLILLAEKGRPGERYIFCNENLTFLDLFNRIARVLNRKEIRFKVPKWTYASALIAAYIKNKTMGNNEGKVNLMTPQIIKESYNYKYYNSRKARSELNWKPGRFLEEAVIEALGFYKKEGLITNGQ